MPDLSSGHVQMPDNKGLAASIARELHSGLGNYLLNAA